MKYALLIEWNLVYEEKMGEKLKIPVIQWIKFIKTKVFKENK